VDVVGLSERSLNAISLLLSVWALFKARGARQAVDKVIEKNDNQTTRDKAQAIKAQLATAKNAAMGRKRGASAQSSAGRALSDDKQAVNLAQDALATVSFSTNMKLAERMHMAATELNSAIDLINRGDQDGWAQALTTLQGVIPELDLWLVELGAKNLR
jgi:hypothetical protein